LHNHAACRSRGRIRLKIICLGDAWALASKAEQTEHYGRDQRENLNGEQMIRFHRRTLFSPIELTSKQRLVTIWLLCRPVEPSNRKSANNISEDISVGHANKSLQRAAPTH